MLGHLVEEEAGGEALALEPALHVGEGQGDGVDLARVDQRAQLVEGERGAPTGGAGPGGPGCGGAVGHGGRPPPLPRSRSETERSQRTVRPGADSTEEGGRVWRAEARG